MIRIYYTEPWLAEFEATVEDVREADGRTLVYLDRTAFYPTSGGQPHDTGRLDDVDVVDVVDEENRVAHVVSAPVIPGSHVRGVIDWGRRLDHMQQHTGQHILSAAFDRLFKVRTQSFHLGGDVSTIDLAREVTADELSQAEAASNAVVWDDRPVSVRFVSEEEAAQLPLRKEPPRGGRLRLVDIDGFDLSACGGTHVERTGRVGIVAVSGTERIRGGTRVAFVCGSRALRDFRTMRDTLDRAARPLTVRPSDLPAAIERLQQESKDQRRSLRDMALRLADLEAGTIAARGEQRDGVSWIVEELDGYDVASLKALAAAIVAAGGRVCVLGARPEPRAIVVARSSDVPHIDAGALLRAVVGRFGGKGGGKGDLAQGGGLAAPWNDVRRFVLETGR